MNVSVSLFTGIDRPLSEINGWRYICAFFLFLSSPLHANEAHLVSDSGADYIAVILSSHWLPFSFFSAWSSMVKNVPDSANPHDFSVHFPPPRSSHARPKSWWMIFILSVTPGKTGPPFDRASFSYPMLAPKCANAFGAKLTPPAPSIKHVFLSKAIVHCIALAR